MQFRRPATLTKATCSRDNGTACARLPVLVVMHKACSDPGHVGQWLRAHGYGLDIRRPVLGEPLPETLQAHSGAVVFGGPMSANDDDDFVRAEIDWMHVPLSEGKPLLGICLGAQILARFLGAPVGEHPDGMAEIGYHPIRPTAEGRALFAWPDHVYQWHREGFGMADGMALLAEGDCFVNQAFSYGPAAVGIQFHPEITRQMVHRWTTRAPERLELPGAAPRRDHVNGHMRFATAQRRWLDAFMTRWVRAGARAFSGKVETGFPSENA